MKDQKDPDDIEVRPVPYDFTFQHSAEDASNIAIESEAEFYESNTPSELD